MRLQQLTSEVEYPATRRKKGPHPRARNAPACARSKDTPMHCRLSGRVVSITGSRNIVNLLLLGLLALNWSGCGGYSTPARTLLSIAVEPGDGEATAPTGTLPFTATGTFDQPPTTKDNLNAQWSSSDTTVATVDPSTGLATCVSVGGPVVITASSGTKQGTAQLTCSASVSSRSGNCAYVCGSTRCGALTGFCSSTQGNACRQVYDPGSCPIGKPAGGTATDSCGVGVDTTRTCP